MELLLFIFATAYLTFSLRLDLHHKGPGIFSGAVIRKEDGSLANRGAFDFIRYLFGVYAVVKTETLTIWQVRVKSDSLWYCGYCLSFWTQLPFLVYDLLITHLLPVSYLLFFLFIIPLFSGMVNQSILILGTLAEDSDE